MTVAAAAPQGAGPEGQLSVDDALALMQQAVRRGELQEAAAVGARAAVPLSLRIDDLSLLGELASGGEATVLYGSLADGADVAVKRFKMTQADDLRRFRRELSLLARLGAAGARHVVPLLGARALPPDYLLVMPLAAATLHARLYTLGWRPAPAELLSLALQAALGLESVHALGIVHRDLKPSNMLVSEQGCLWLSDFGLAGTQEEVAAEAALSVSNVRSRGKPTGGFHKRALKGTLEYMAPEVLLKRPASQASDVYALAVTINELATGVFPFSDCTKDNPEVHTVLEHGYGRQELAAAVAAEGLRPMPPRAEPGSALAGLVGLLHSAWQLDPAARPSASQVARELERLLAQAQAEEAAAGAGRREQQQQQQPRAHLLLHAAAGPAQRGGACMAGAGDGSVDACSTVDSELDDDCGMDWGCCSSDDGAAARRRGLRRASSCSTLGASSASASDAQSPHGGGEGRRGGSAARRAPRESTSSASTGSAELEPFGGTALAGGWCGRQPGGEAASAAAAAAAAAAAPAEALAQGVLSQTAAAAAAAGAAADAPMPVVDAGAFAAVGPREAMEDRNVVVRGLGGDAAVTLAAVFDGHRGAEAAAYAAAQLPRQLLLASVRLSAEAAERGRPPPLGAPSGEQPAADGGSGAAAALREAFLATDEAFSMEWQAEMHACASAGQYAERFPGCTALAALVAGRHLFVANAGDGRAVLSRGGAALPLSRQHTADLPDERARVAAAGGAVAVRGGSWRVGAAALQVTRAIGDFDLKRRGGASGGQPVTAEPEVVSLALRAEDQFLVLGTDGLWDVLGDQEAVGLVRDTVKDPALAAKRLVMEALSRGSADNVTAAVVFLRPTSTLERVWVRGGGAGAGAAPVPDATPTFYGSRRATAAQLAAAAGSDGAGAGAAAQAPEGAADEFMDTY